MASDSRPSFRRYVGTSPDMISLCGGSSVGCFYRIRCIPCGVRSRDYRGSYDLVGRPVSIATPIGACTFRRPEIFHRERARFQYPQHVRGLRRRSTRPSAHYAAKSFCTIYNTMHKGVCHAYTTDVHILQLQRLTSFRARISQDARTFTSNDVAA